MTISQSGSFEHGTYGFPVKIQLAGNDVSLVDATVIHIAVRRPAQSSYNIARDLIIPDDIVDIERGIIKWPVLSGELTVRGYYRIVVTIDFGAETRLTVDGDMLVT